MAQTMLERIDALKAKEASLIDEAGQEGFEGKLADVRVQLSSMRDQRKFLEEQSAAVAADKVTRTEQASAEDVSGDVPVELSDEVAGAQEELQGRLAMDSAYNSLRVRLDAEGGLPDQEGMMLQLASDSPTEQSKVPLGQGGNHAVTIRLGAAKALSDFLKMPGSPTVRDYLDFKVALDYTTAAGTAAGNLGDTIPTLVDSMFHEIDESINGVRRVGGIQRVMTPTAAKQQWPVFVEAGIGTLAQNLGTENVDVGDAQKREGYADVVETEPYEFVGWAEVSKNILAKSAVSLLPVITRGLARSSSRMTERAMAQGSGVGQPIGIFQAAPGNNVQAAATGGRAVTEEILALPGQITDLDMGGDPVWGLHRTNWFEWIRQLKDPAVGYTIAGQPDGQFIANPGMSSMRVIDGAQAYFFTYAPSTTGATDYYLIYFLPSAFMIHEWDRLELSRDDSIGFLARRATFLVSRWCDSVWFPTSQNTQARASIQGKA